MGVARVKTAALRPDDDVLARLVALEHHARATDATLKRLIALVLPSADRKRLGAVLAAVAGAFGSSAFTVADLFRSDAPGVVLTRRALSPRRLGQLLATAEDMVIAGHVLRGAGVEHNARVWMIERVVRPKAQSGQVFRPVV